MNMPRPRWRIGALVAALAVCSLIGPSIKEASGEPPSSKQMRQTRFFERVMDDMLIDSRNFLVPGRENTRAYHVPGHGMVVTFQTTLVDRGRGGISIWNWGDGGRRSLRWDDDDDWDDYDDDDDDDGKDRKRRSRRSRSSDREERRYERGKQEIVEVLLDYGDQFESLGAGEWVEVIAFLGDADLFYDRDIERLIVRAKVSDLKSYGDGSLDEKAMESRVQIEEY